ncbi:MAG: YceI family protein [Chitinophagaceae bacterium]|nr:YceI family protein [Chitinophagaceae bacterium]
MKKIVPVSAFLLTVAIIVSSFIGVEKTPAFASVTNNSKNFATKWTLDKGHSNVKFTVTHMVVSDVDGSFKNFDGTVEHTKPDYSDAVVTFTVDVASVNTDNENRDKHLKSDDFFNAEKFPQMKFQSTSFKPLGGNKYQLDGNLTIRDITKPVSFEVTYGGSIDTQRGKKIGFKAKTTVNRFDYNLKWDRATEAGSLVVAKEVVITINTEFNEVKTEVK